MRWLVRAYLRVRLQKVNTNCVAILETPELRARLSEEELRYAEGYRQLVHNHATSTVTARLAKHTALSVEEGARLLPRPEDEYVVFCRAEEELGDVDLGDENGCAAPRPPPRARPAPRPAPPTRVPAARRFAKLKQTREIDPRAARRCLARSRAAAVRAGRSRCGKAAPL
jgi:hypothetical protein